MDNCPNCGAPKRGSVCEYCGTHFARYQGEATVEVESDYVDIYTWDGCTTYRIYNAPNVTIKMEVLHMESTDKLRNMGVGE